MQQVFGWNIFTFALAFVRNIKLPRTKLNGNQKLLLKNILK